MCTNVNVGMVGCILFKFRHTRTHTPGVYTGESVVAGAATSVGRGNVLGVIGRGGSPVPLAAATGENTDFIVPAGVEAFGVDAGEPDRGVCAADNVLMVRSGEAGADAAEISARLRLPCVGVPSKPMGAACVALDSACLDGLPGIIANALGRARYKITSPEFQYLSGCEHMHQQSGQGDDDEGST